MPRMRVSYNIERYAYVEVPEGADEEDAITAAERQDNWLEGDADDYIVEEA